MLKTLVANLISLENIDGWLVKKVATDDYYEAWKTYNGIKNNTIIYLPIISTSNNIETDNNHISVSGWKTGATIFSIGSGYQDNFTVYHNTAVANINVYVRIKYK